MISYVNNFDDLSSLTKPRLHNPDNTFHFMLEWTNATARLVEDSLLSWANTVIRFGLKLVQVPFHESSKVAEINPLRSPYEITMALKGPEISPKTITDSPTLKPQQSSSAKYLQKELLKRFDFVLDHEAYSSFPSDVEVAFSWGAFDYEYDQYIHRSGLLLAQIVDDWKFSLLANRLYNNRVSAFREAMSGRDRDAEKSKGSSMITRNQSGAALSNMTGTAASPVLSPLMQHQSRGNYVSASDKRDSTSKYSKVTAESLKDDLEAFCRDTNSLKAFYEDVNRQLAEKPTPALSALSVAATPSLQASIPSLDLPEVDSTNDFTAL